MIDSPHSEPNTDGGNTGAGTTRAAHGLGSEFFGQLFQQAVRHSGVPAMPIASTSALPQPATSTSIGGGIVPPPTEPANLREAGLGLVPLADLILKQLYLTGGLLGSDIAKQLRLPFNVVDEGLVYLREEKCIEVTSGQVLGRVSYRFQLTDLGRTRARDAFEQCRYVGPAPVPLEAYVRQCLRQSVSGTVCTPEALVQAFEGLIIRDGLLDELGPAVCSGKSIFIYGPPGNGKTQVAKGLGRFLNQHGGSIFVPYALLAENSIITLFDPSLHRPVDTLEQAGADDPGVATNADRGRLFRDAGYDLRWRRIRRPIVITGGELTLEMLDLRYNATANYYQAPLHLKANGGVFLIDDFGRQIVSPKALLNRWILPLEERIDYLTLTTGKKLSVPFEQLIMFSTNLEPRDLVDDAFLRRIRHKIHIPSPDRSLFTDIFRLVCQQHGLDFSPNAVAYLFSQHYDLGRIPRSSDPRDLLQIIQSVCRFRNQEVQLTDELISNAARRFFGEL
jgi:hypothetical protein